MFGHCLDRCNLPFHAELVRCQWPTWLSPCSVAVPALVALATFLSAPAVATFATPTTLTVSALAAAAPTTVLTITAVAHFPCVVNHCLNHCGFLE